MGSTEELGLLLLVDTDFLIESRRKQTHFTKKLSIVAQIYIKKNIPPGLASAFLNPPF